MFKTAKERLLLMLIGFFITNAVVAELISNKLIDIPAFAGMGPFTVIIGILPWPIVFLVTDTMNEFYGKAIVKRVSYITCVLIAYAFLIVTLAMLVPANTSITPSTATDAEFNKVFGQSRWVIVGSIMAFLISQILDVYIFTWIKEKTNGKFIWLRATFSTLISQLIDSYTVLFIGFYLPDKSGQFTLGKFLSIGFNNYSFKIIIAIALIPAIYLLHGVIKRYLKKETTE